LLARREPYAAADSRGALCLDCFPNRRRHHARGPRCSSRFCRRLPSASRMSAAMSNSRSSPAASSGGLARPRRSETEEREGRRAGRVFRRTNMCCPSMTKRSARWCDTIVTEFFERVGLDDSWTIPGRFPVRRCAMSARSLRILRIFPQVCLRQGSPFNAQFSRLL